MHQQALINIIYTYNWLTERTKSIFDNEDITVQQYNIMRILRGAGKPMSTLQIRHRMLDKMSDTSRIVDRIVMKGYAAKNLCASDKRLVDVTITAKGLDLLSKIDPVEKQLHKLLHNLSTEETNLLNTLLDKIRS